MDVQAQDIQALLQLQELDQIRFQAEAKLRDMPHKQQVLDGRRKRKEVQAKFDQVEHLLSQAKAEKQKLLAEDEQLVAKQADVQEQINASSDDYRKVTTLTRDLEGMAKRRETLAFQGKGIDERIAQVKGVYDSVVAALEVLDKKEQDLVDDYQAKSIELAEQAKGALAKRSDIVKSLPEDVLSAYEHAVSLCGGVGIALLKGDKCSACRSTIDANRLLQVRKEAPLSHCPSCSRLLVVE